MALPTAYLTSTKNLEGILMAIQNAEAPPKFTVAFVQSLGYSSVADRLIINVLKALGFLTSGGVPGDRYFRYLDPAQSGLVLAEGIREAYADLFQVNKRAQSMSRAELKGKLKVLTQGKLSDAVIDKMAMTFEALCKRADWSSAAPVTPTPIKADEDSESVMETDDGDLTESLPADGIRLGGLVYNIQIQLPESRDQAVYDAFFKSLKAHLLQ
jgi:hypothetical protein